MIAALIAAVIAQPLDATYSTDQSPRKTGVHLTFRYPSSWQVRPSMEANSVCNIAAPDGRSFVAMWIVPDVLTLDTPQTRNDEVYKVLWECLERATPPNVGRGEGRQVMINGRRAARGFQTADGTYAGELYGFTFKKSAVILFFECNGEGAIARYAQSKPLVESILLSLSEPETQREHSIVPAVLAGLVAVVVVGAVVHRFISSRGSRSPAANRTARGRRT